MASIYCTDCTRQAGDDNWTECYYCGGKNLKKTRRARAEAQAKKPRKKTRYSFTRYKGESLFAFKARVGLRYWFIILVGIVIVNFCEAQQI